MKTFHVACRAVAAAILLLPIPAAADPIDLKLSFWSSDRSQNYQTSIKPFVDAVNAEGGGLVHVEVYFSGAISSVQSRQPQLVADGTADLALIVPGRTPERFHDTSVMELPGLFPDLREAARVFTKLARDGTLAGYEDFFVVDAFISGPESIQSRKPIASTADLKGLRIRVNNSTEADVLQRFGAIPVLLAINKTTEAISSGTIDGATAPPSMLAEFGMGRVTTHHFMIGLGGVPIALLMNRKKFESLPAAAQAVIRAHSGQWLSDYTVKRLTAWDHEVLDALEQDPRRAVVYPGAADAKAIQAVFDDVIREYAASSDHSRQLLARVRAALADRSTSE